MLSANAFDQVYDSQAVFRQLLKAGANPGKIVSIADQSVKCNTADSVMFTLAVTLLGRESTYRVVDNDLLSQSIFRATYARHCDAAADYIFIPRLCEPGKIKEILEWATPGTLVAPHTNSVLFVMVDGFDATVPVKLSGPGIKGIKRVGLSDYARTWLEERDAMEYEYPTGVDLYFTDSKGSLMAVSRKIMMEG